MSESLFSRLQKLNKEATEGPWSWMDCGEKDSSWALGVAVDPTTEQPLTGNIHDWETEEDAEADIIEMVAENPSSNARLTDAALIVECRNSLPAVLNLIEAAQRVAILEYDARKTDAQNDELQRRGRAFREAVAVFVSGQEEPT